MYLFFNKIFYNLDECTLKSKFLKLGLKEGMNIYVHSSLSKFGYVKGGADSIINVLFQIIGKGTIMMPTFTKKKENFSLEDPCWTGIVAEKFRKMPFVKRSIHLTHSVACIGKYADWLVKDHEISQKPFDENSPFAKFSKIDSYILMLGTENNSMIHYIQNNLNFPNLFLSKDYTYFFKDKKFKTKIHNPKGAVTYILNNKPCSDVKFLVTMYKDLEFKERDIIKTIKIGNAKCHLINTKEFVEEATKYLQENIKKYKEQYLNILKDENY